MNELDVTDVEAALEQIRAQAQTENVRITVHAQQEMVDEDISLEQVLQAITTGQILENYPQHRCGACCLVNGLTQHGRPLHVVCTTAQPVLILITTYEPKPPKWITPTQRGRER
jgi:Domain of unknown function (DUF4258)